MNAPATGPSLPARWSPAWIEARLGRERERNDRFHRVGSEDGLRLPLHYKFLRTALKAVRLYDRGYRNYADIRITRITHTLRDWPLPLEGFRILQLSDLHIDLDPAILPVIRQQIRELNCEMAVITGDFIESARTGHESAKAALCSIIEEIGETPFGRFGVLGNHDSLELAAALEEMGLPMLVNEARVLGSGPTSFALAGVDDAYFFKTHDLPAVARLCPAAVPRILLSHSPQLAAEASHRGFSLMLSGHTHGGQICLPGGHSILSMAEIPKPLFRGSWRYGPLAGYTSTGTGACHLPIRFNCPPEVVLHTLRAAGRLT